VTISTFFERGAKMEIACVMHKLSVRNDILNNSRVKNGIQGQM
jgi:hypothetical protein